MKHRKIVITGPESCGKTDLSRQLAAKLKAGWVREYAREYLEHLGRPYQQHDLLTIAREQVNLEEQALSQYETIVCDTDLTVIKIWSEFKYDFCDPWITRYLFENPAGLYLLSFPDLPWKPDPQRENPFDRLLLFDFYEELLQKLSANYTVIKGQGTQRVQNALNAIQMHLG